MIKKRLDTVKCESQSVNDIIVHEPVDDQDTVRIDEDEDVSCKSEVHDTSGYELKIGCRDQYSEYELSARGKSFSNVKRLFDHGLTTLNSQSKVIKARNGNFRQGGLG